MFHLERRHQKLLPRRLFVLRLVRFTAAALGLVCVALGIGVAGYHSIAGFGLVDSILSATMILTGMGPVGELNSTAAKLFTSAYALFSGLVFVTAIGVLLAPIAHRVLHKFHMDEGGTVGG